MTKQSFTLDPAVGGRIDHFQDVRAASEDYIHEAIVGTGTEQVITTNITHPDIGRNASITVTDNNFPSGGVRIDGVNTKGESVFENLVIVAGGTVYGNEAWVTIASITISAGVSVSDTVKVGVSDKIGLSMAILSVEDVIKKRVNGIDKSSEILGNVDLVYDTLNCTTITRDDDITIWTRRHLI